jgi:chemotaxis protein methyltransferase CheR
VTPADFQYLRQFLKLRSGCVVSNEKQYLVESRLLPLARRAGLSTIRDVVERLRLPNETALAEAVVEAMTCGETSFFRDRTPFETLTSLMLPEILRRRAATRRIRIWSAGCASGQEPYSIAMALREAGVDLAGWTVDILGTDISNEALERARLGVYSQFEVQRGLPIRLLLKYFARNGGDWTIAGELRQMVRWRKANLLDDFAALGRFDVVFCRNVLVGFDPPTRDDVLARLVESVADDGYLVLGAAESVIGVAGSVMPHPQARGLLRPNRAARPSSVTPDGAGTANDGAA